MPDLLSILRNIHISGGYSSCAQLDDVSPMIGLLANLSPEVTVYGTYSTSFETPTTTEFANHCGAGGFNPLLEPQAATNLEVGLRGVRGRARYELAVFDVEADDELIPYEIPSSPGRDFFANAGSSSRTGLEATLVSRPTDRVGVTLSYTYADFTFADFVDDNGREYSGNRIPGTVEQLLFAEIDYRHPAGWFGALDARYVGDQYTNNANTVADRCVHAIELAPWIRCQSGRSDVFGHHRHQQRVRPALQLQHPAQRLRRSLLRTGTGAKHLCRGCGELRSAPRVDQHYAT